MGTPRGLDSSGTLERGLAVLEHVGQNQEISTNAIARQLGLSRSAAYRIVGTLKNLEYLEADRATGRVRLGTRLVELGARAMAATDLHRCAPRYLASLAERSGETTYLAVPDNDTMVYVATERSANAVTLACRLGTRRPQHATSLGKAWLAALPEQDRVERIRRMKLDSLTLKTINDPARLLDDLARTSRRGWAVDEVENEPDVGCVAAAVRDHTGRPIAAISIAGPAGRVLRRTDELGATVAGTAAALSLRLGYVRARRA
ncbi:IclR family transcriptional regulator [Amycolatopsis sp. cmx-11-51]|uniref:IclR family transcriptional regulator n=1 Tax=unclassified Amycolatopsis TaxID=2618356 RepID=UPI0039E5D65E